MNKVTRLKAPMVPFPNGGALRAMANNKAKVHDKMRAELKAKHEREAAELEFKISEDKKKQVKTNASR